MTRLPGDRLTPIGICFDERFVRAAQLSGPPGARRLHAAVRLPRACPGPPPAAPEVRGLLRVLWRQRFRGRRAVLGVPEQRLLTGVLELPPRTSGAPVEQIARTELGRMHGHEPESAETVCWDLPASPRAKDATQVMAVACPHTEAETLLAAFDQGGLHVIALDSHLQALVRASRRVLDGAAMAAVLDIEWDWALLGVLYRGQVIYQRLMPEAGVKVLTEGVAQQLGLEADWVNCLLLEVGLSPPAAGGPEDRSALEEVQGLLRAYLESLRAELDAPFAYGAAQYPGNGVERLVLTGLGAAMPGAAEHLASRMDLAVRTLAPAGAVECPPVLADRSADPSLATAVGLAMFHDRQPTPGRNLIPARRIEATRHRRRVCCWVGVCAGLGVVLSVAYLSCLALWGGGRGALAEELKKVRARSQQTSGTIQTVRQMLSASELTLRANRAVKEQPDWSTLLALLARALSDEVVLRQCELKPSSLAGPGAEVRRAGQGDGTFVLRLAGYGRTQTAVSEFVLNLEHAGLFDEVKLIKTSREPFLSGSAVAFQVDCALGRRAGEEL